MHGCAHLQGKLKVRGGMLRKLTLWHSFDFGKRSLVMLENKDINPNWRHLSHGVSNTVLFKLHKDSLQHPC